MASTRVYKTSSFVIKIKYLLFGRIFYVFFVINPKTAYEIYCPTKNTYSTENFFVELNLFFGKTEICEKLLYFIPKTSLFEVEVF